ncbi:hypothetical protein [Candidatus Phycosocius spiralis]|uniref:Sel1 repeat family protein n=1 Tax=Candidatus Phycosocius spiralis TaxID=2815099 RepID=A0ABQ4PVW5_9PROT|nr:hypothetical protein [Candidatus Phycosocius spiralis]GIU67116.1 hypothetical protein PsB1_1270 [Candidatus Phycosocius spiralis]
MSGQTPSSVKGLEPKTREAAKDLARREGLTLGELLNRLIADIEEPKPESNPPSQILSQPGLEGDRLTTALEQLTRRLEASGLEVGSNSPEEHGFEAKDTLPPVAIDVGNKATPSLGDSLVKNTDATPESIGPPPSLPQDLTEAEHFLVDKISLDGTKEPETAHLASMHAMEAVLHALKTQMTATENRVGEIEHIIQESLQTLDRSLDLVTQRLSSTETLAQETNRRFLDGMVDLSARITSLESNPDINLQTGAGHFENRIAQIESLSTQVKETLDHTMAKLGDQADRIQEFTQDNATRMVDALIELSARITQVEAIGTTGDLRLAIEALESKSAQIASQMSELSTRLGEKDKDANTQSETAISSKIDRRFIDLAQALADRLDATDKRNQEVFEQFNNRLIHANDDLNLRITQLETHSQTDASSEIQDVKTRLEHLSRLIETRLSSFEDQNGSSLGQAGERLHTLAESLGHKLDSSEIQSTQTMTLLTQQMDKWAERLQANQEGTFTKLTSRLEDHEARTQALLDEVLGRVRHEIKTAEDRTQRAAMSLAARIETVEQATVAPYAEAILDIPNIDGTSSSLAFDPDAISAIDDYSFETGPGSFGSTSYEDPFATREPNFTPPLNATNRGRVGGFGSPFPSEVSADGLSDSPPMDIQYLSEEEVRIGEDQGDPTRSADQVIDLGQELIGPPLLDVLEEEAESAFIDLDQDWDDLVPLHDPDSSSYHNPISVTSADESALEIDAPVLNAKNRDEEKSGPKKAKSAQTQRKTHAVRGNSATRQAKLKPSMAPVAMAAALVTSGAFAVYSLVQTPAELNQKPDVHNQDPADKLSNAANVDPLNQSASHLTPVPAPISAQLSESALMSKEAKEKPSFNPPSKSAQQGLEKAQFNPPPPNQATKARFTQPPIERTKPDPINARITPKAERKSASPTQSVTKATINQNLDVTLSSPGQLPVTSPSPQVRTTPSLTQSSRSLFEQALAREQVGDLVGSLALLNRAVEAGDMLAMNRLAKKYETGDGVAKDLGKARVLTERAAARGSSEAMHNLGVYYAQGDGVPSDMARAADYFHRAARRGIADSQFNLGAMAEQGLGGPKSDLQAYYWYSIASKSGDQDAEAKAREIGKRLSNDQRAAQDKLVAQFRPEISAPE